MTIFTFEFVWFMNVDGEKKTCVKLVTGTQEQIDEYKQLLAESPDVLAASMTYVCEYDFARRGQYDVIKKEEEKKEDETA